MPLVGLGGLLVIVCVLGYAYGTLRLGDRIEVLAVARPVAAGQTLAEADLMRVPAAREQQIQLVPAAQTSQVIGRTAVVPLLPGTLLTPSLLGDAGFPPAGKVTASVSVKPGQYPQGLASGARVAVYVTPSPNAAQDASQPAPSSGTDPAETGVRQRLPAVVLGVDLAGDGQGSTVVTLLLDATDAAVLAGAPAGGVVLMQTSPQDGN